MAKEDEIKKVEVDADVLKKLLDTVERQGEQIKDLTGAADLNRLTRVQQLRNSGKLVKTAKINKYNDKYIIGWSKVKDDVYIDTEGRLHEEQTIELVFEDKTKSKPISYIEFSRLCIKEEGEVIRESKENDGQTFFKIRLDDGKEIELSIAFIN